MDSFTASQVAAGFEAMLLAPALQPLFADCDALGGYGANVLATALARRDGAFGDLVARELGARPR